MRTKSEYSVWFDIFLRVMTKHKPKMFGGLILCVIFDKYIVRNDYKVYLNLSFNIYRYEQFNFEF